MSKEEMLQDGMTEGQKPSCDPICVLLEPPLFSRVRVRDVFLQTFRGQTAGGAERPCWVGGSGRASWRRELDLER